MAKKTEKEAHYYIGGGELALIFSVIAFVWSVKAKNADTPQYADLPRQRDTITDYSSPRRGTRRAEVPPAKANSERALRRPDIIEEDLPDTGTKRRPPRRMEPEKAPKEPAIRKKAVAAFDSAVTTTDDDETPIIYRVPVAVDGIFQRITAGDTALYKLMVNLLGSESGFKKYATSRTGVHGFAQMEQDTFIERAFFDRDKMPREHRATLYTIIRYDAAAKEERDRVLREWARGRKAEQRNVRPRYEYKFAGATQEERLRNREAVLALRSNLLVSGILAREHIRTMLVDARQRFEDGLRAKIASIRRHTDQYDLFPNERLKKLEQELERPFTIADAKIIYVSGARGGSEILVAMADPATRDHKISDYADPGVVSANPRLFTRNGRDLNPQEFRAHIEKRVGTMVIPDEMIRTGHAGQNQPIRALG